MKLVIGNTNYSSWSLRAWFAAKMSGLPFDEVQIDLDGPDTAARIARHSPSGKVPVLIDGDVVVWESLAIVEYLAEVAPHAGLWPAERNARAHARSIVAEFHAGFPAFRKHYPMNVRRPVRGRPYDAAAEAEVARVRSIWRETRNRFGGGGTYLFGSLTAADAFYAPVASRFRTYAIETGEIEAEYVDALLVHPAMTEWTARARAETWIVPADEVD